MATLLSEARMAVMGDLRYQPTDKRIRAVLDGYSVADSTRAVLVWEPRRVLPSYALPAEDLKLELSPSTAAPPDDGPSPDAPVLHGAHAFTIHSTEGEALDVSVKGATRPGAAFRSADPDLAGLVVLDYQAFEYWYEEDEPIVGHPRDPFHRVDTRLSSRHVVIEADGHLVADSTRPQLVFETSLPVRFYLPREDVRVDLRASDKVTHCAYKGRASYWSFDAGGSEYANLAWTYNRPLSGADALTGLVAFFDEKFDVTVDGEPRSQQRDAVAATVVEESGV
jgi:uncharacterized protein (DUF427 family)